LNEIMTLYNLTQALIKLPSPTGSEHAVVKFLREYLEAAGFEVQLQEVNNRRANIYARVGEPTLVLSTHTDTVLPALSFNEDEAYIYGRGACDTKGIIAAQIKAVEKLRADGVQNVGLLFVVGEENGSDGARAANTIPNQCRFLINGEPTENKLALGSKGALRVEVITRGRAAHSAYPQQGDSAILKLLEVLNDIRGLDLPTHPVLGATTCNIGTIAGGVQANVIPDFAKAELLFRIVTDVASIKNLLEQTLAGRAQINYTFECEPVFMDALPGFETAVVSFTTDIPLLNNWGRPLLLGPGSILDAHTPHERIAKTELVRAVEIYYQIAKNLLDKVDGV
jgi:acetylornithine deacetylase/succinyl-diaminopimelate desuccinylase-like protein